jgi:hypothetical protein
MALTFAFEPEGYLRLSIVGPFPDTSADRDARERLRVAWPGSAVLLDLRHADPASVPEPAEMVERARAWSGAGRPARCAVVAPRGVMRVAQSIASLRIASVLRIFADDRRATRWLSGHAGPSLAARALLDVDRPDDELVAMSLRMVADAADEHDSSPVIVCHGMPDGVLSDLLGPDAIRTLQTRHRLDFDGTSFAVRLVSDEGRRHLRDHVVLALWLNDRELSLVEDAAPAVLCVVPWLRSQCRDWIAVHRPAVLPIPLQPARLIS